MKATSGPIDATILRGIHGIQAFGDLPRLVFRDKVFKGRCVHPTSRQAKAPGERLGRIEQVVRNGQRNFHTLVIPWYKRKDKLGR